MPVAFCRVDLSRVPPLPPLEDRFANAVDAWANAARVDAKHLTLQVQAISLQVGRRYAAIATVALPTLWSPPKTQAILLGLSQTLCQTLAVDAKEVLVFAQPLASGTIVDEGDVVEWDAT